MPDYIGIERQRGLLYEGSSLPYGHAVWPAPVVTPATFIYESQGVVRVAQPSDDLQVSHQFREDHFDPTSRIRRGRFYKRVAGAVQPYDWHVPAHPAISDEPPTQKKSLLTFGSMSIWHEHINGRREQPLILLGVDDRYTVWSITHVEAIATGEEIVTLKGRNSFGILPKIDEEKVPAHFRASLARTLDGFVEDVRRAGPSSVVDRAREAATHTLLAYFNKARESALDLSDLTKLLETQGTERLIAISAAKIIQRLHSRGKPAEQEKRSLPLVTEQDAELAVQCVGALLCEVGLARWE